MIAGTEKAQFSPSLLEQHLPLAHVIALRLKQRYTWLEMEDLYSYSLLGLMLAVQTYDANRGIQFSHFASQKAMFLAIDQMRGDRVLHRASSHSPRLVSFGDGSSGEYSYARDKHSEEDMNCLEARDVLACLFRHLQPCDRRLLQLYYVDEMTFLEISRVMGVSESAISLRHKNLLARLRKLVASKVS